MTDIWFLLIEGIFGVPAVLLLGRLFTRLVCTVPPLFKAHRVKATLALVIVLICSVGVLSYAFVFTLELYELLNCKGAGCAQGGLGTFVFTPIAWLSWLLTWWVARAVFSPKFFPHLSGLTLCSSGTAQKRSAP